VKNGRKSSRETDRKRCRGRETERKKYSRVKEMGERVAGRQTDREAWGKGSEKK
jgi:hypothetical protein